MKPTVKKQRTNDWYERRLKLSVTGSSVATVLGRGMGSLPDLFREKVERKSKRKTNPCMERGIALEEHVCRAYERLFNVKVNDTGLFISRQHEYIGVSPDGEREHDHVLLEFKVAVTRHLQDTIPDHYYDQCQCSLMVVETAPYLEYFETAIEPIGPANPAKYDGWRYFCHDGQQWVIRDYRHHRIDRDPTWVAAALPLINRFHRHVTTARRRVNRKRTRSGATSIDRYIASNVNLTLLYKNPVAMTEDLARCAARHEISLLSNADSGMFGWIRLRRVEVCRRVTKRLNAIKAVTVYSPKFYRLGTFSTVNALESRNKPRGAGCIIGNSWIDSNGIPANPWLVMKSVVARRLFGAQVKGKGYVLIHCVGGIIQVHKDGSIGNNRWWCYMRALLGVQASVLRQNNMMILDQALVVGSCVRRGKNIIPNQQGYDYVSVCLEHIECKPVLDRMLQIKDGTIDPRTMFGWKPASLDCPEVRKHAIKLQHISLLPKIRENEMSLLYRHKCYTLQDLADKSLVSMFPKRKIARFWERFVDFHSNGTDTIAVHDRKLLASKFVVPRGTTAIFVDIESFPADMENDSKPWVFTIGHGYGKRRFKFTPTIMHTRSRSAELDMVRRFFAALPNRPCVRCYHWGHIDRTSIARLCSTDKQLLKQFEKIEWVDMCDVLRRSGFMLRNVYCYKLKHITRGLFGNLYRTVGIDNGADAMLKAWDLYRSESNPQGPVLDTIIEYNRLDCEMLQKIRMHLVQSLELF